MTVAPLHGVHVAVAGDDSDALEFLAQGLRYHGALVTTHDSARTVTRLMQVLLVNVLVVDLRDVSDVALKLIRNVRALPPRDGGRVPMVVLFAGPPEAEPRLVAEDVESVVRKPVQATELARIVATVAAAAADPARET